jgi:hypothetical protein
MGINAKQMQDVTLALIQVFAMMLIAITVLVTVLPYSQVNIWV